MIDYGENEKIWTIEELELINDFDTVRCVQCESLLGLKSGGALKHSEIHNKFYKFDHEKEVKAKQIQKEEDRKREHEVIFTVENKIKLNQKLGEIKKESDKYGCKTYLAIITGLSSLVQMKIHEEMKPHTVLFTGNATNKEIMINTFKKIPITVHVNSFTPKSFVTHSARHSTKSLRNIDLLPKIRNKGMFTSNADRIFLGNKPTVKDNIGMLDTVLEGNGYESHSAVHGVRGYTGNYNFVWLGTINPVNRHVYEVIGEMNNKPLFFKLDDNQVENNIKDMIQSLSQTEDSSDNTLVNTVESFWTIISDLFIDDEKVVPWDKSKDSAETCENIINYGIFLTDLRAHLPTKNTRESTSGGTNYNFDNPIRENCNKLSKTLYNLARSHAIIHGRNYITEEDLEIVVHVVMSSLPQDRLNLFEVLLCNNGTVDTTQIEKHLKVSKATALKEMEKFRVLEIVDEIKIDGKSKPTSAIQLKEKHSWIMDNKFKFI